MQGKIRMKRFITAAAITFAATLDATGLPEGEFRDPSAVNRPETWFHFIGGNVARPGITADLEAIKGAGISGIHLFHGQFGGKFGLWQTLQLMWDLKVRKASDRVFGIIFGITPEFQGKGIESAIMTYIHDTYVLTGRSPYKEFEFAWIGDFNPVMNRMIERYVCATRHKMHTTYRYLFDRTKEFTRCPRVGFRKREKSEQSE